MRAETHAHESPSRALVPWLLVLAAGLSTGAAAVMVLSAPGCAASACTTVQSGADPGGLPADALECPSATVCYEGACVPSCASAAERSEPCKASGDCKNGARSRCVDGFCSACNTGERCLPRLELCARVRPDPNGDAGTPSVDVGSVPARGPVDGGAIDGQVLTFDGGIETPVFEDLATHTADLFIRELRRPSTSTVGPETRFELTALDVRNTGYVRSGTIADPIQVSDFGTCELRHYDQFPLAAPRPANLGDVTLRPCDPACSNEDADPPVNGGLFAVYSFRWTPANFYRASPTSIPVLRPSTSARIVQFGITGTGIAPITTGSWPTPPVTFLSPIALELAPETLRQFQAPQRLDSILAGPGALELSWVRAQDSNDIRRLNARVELTIEPRPGMPRTAYLRCVSDDREVLAKLRVPGDVLSQLRTAANAAGQTWELRLERVTQRRVDTNSDVQNGYSVRFLLSAGQGYVTRFQL